jgi:hypothetical protein
MTTHDIPNRRRRATVAVGAALGLAVSLGRQFVGGGPETPMPMTSAAADTRLDCPAPVAL